MNPKLSKAAYALCREAGKSVEYSDWPELQDAIENVEKADDIGDEPLREALYKTARHLWVILGREETTPQDDQYTGIDNLIWMMSQILSGNDTMPTDKMSRWIGFVQGVMVMKDIISVDGERKRTRPLFHVAYKEMGIKIPKTKTK